MKMTFFLNYRFCYLDSMDASVAEIYMRQSIWQSLPLPYSERTKHSDSIFRGAVYLIITRYFIIEHDVVYPEQTSNSYQIESRDCDAREVPDTTAISTSSHDHQISPLFISRRCWKTSYLHSLSILIAQEAMR